jgi:hypothetical protein
MKQLHKINLCKKLIGISELLEINDSRQADIVAKLNAYDKLDFTHPVKLMHTKDQLIENLETRLFVGKRIQYYYKTTLNKLIEAK